MSIAFAQTDAVYQCLHQLRVEETLVSHALFMEYDKHFKELRRRLKEAVSIDEYARRLGVVERR